MPDNAPGAEGPPLPSPQDTTKADMTSAEAELALKALTLANSYDKEVMEMILKEQAAFNSQTLEVMKALVGHSTAPPAPG